MKGPKFLIIRFSSLGDILLTFPVYRNIKTAYPDSEITVLTKKQFAGVFLGCGEVDRVIPFKSLFSTLKELKSEKFDFLIDLHSNLRSVFFNAFLPAGRKIRYSKDSLYRRIFVNFGIITPALQKHTVERYLKVLGPLGIPVKDNRLYFRDINFGAKNKPAAGKDPANILVIQTAFLGDALLTLPLLKEIKRRFPACRLSVLCRKETVQIFKKVPGIDEVLADNKKTASFFGEFSRLLEEIKRKGFDAAIIPHRSLRSAALARLARIPFRIGFASGAAGLLHTVAVPFQWLIHDVERNLSLLAPLSEVAAPSFPSLNASVPLPYEIRGRDCPVYPDYGEWDGASADVAGLKIKIGVNPSSVWETKRWPRENFAALIKKLSALCGSRIIITGGKNELEYNKKVEEMAGPENCLNLTGKTDLFGLIGAIKAMDLFITNDSGPMHIAAASGVPVVALFGPTTRELGFFPYSENSSVMETPLRCRPCRLHGSRECPRGHFLCMKLLTVETVFKEARKMLKEKAGA